MAENDFVINNGTLTKYTGAGGDVVIPDGVTKIGKKAFESNRSIKAVVISEECELIDDEAFCGCSNIESVTIPQNVKKIGRYSFGYCSMLTLVQLNEGLTTIDEYAFADCKHLKRIIIPSSVKKIGGNAFGSSFGSSNAKSQHSKSPRYVSYSGNSVDPDTLIKALTGCDYVALPKYDIEKLDKLKSAAAIGYAVYCIESGQKSEYHDNYVAYIKKQKSKLYGEIQYNSSVLTFLLSEKLIPLSDADTIQSIVESLNDVNHTALWLDYKNNSFTAKDVKKTEELKEKKAIGAVKLSLADIKKEWRLDGNSITGYCGNNKEIITPVYEGKTPIDTIDYSGLSPDRERRTADDKKKLNSITKITVGPEIKRIHAKAFSGCRQLKCVEILCEDVKLYTGLFAGCDSITEIIIPENARHYGNVFLDCPLYKGKNSDLFIIGDTILGCVSSKKKVVKIPKGVTKIYSMAFDGCDKLTDVYVPNTVTEFLDNGYSRQHPVIHTPAGSEADKYYRNNRYKVINDI